MRRDSQQAAGLKSVLAVGPGWDWTTLSSLYPDMTLYVAQLHALEAYVRQHPQEAGARFLLAYHYLTQGHFGSAASELKTVVSLAPNDQLAADLLSMINGKEPTAPPATTRPTTPTVLEERPPDAREMIGHWRASRDDGSNVELDLAADKSFTWSFTYKQDSQTLAGSYALEKGTLVLQGQSGEMVGVVSGSADRFNFKPLGAEPEDPGLTFIK